MSEEMNDRLKQLSDIQVPTEGEGARQRALSAAMMAFEAAKSDKTKTVAPASKGIGAWARLRSILQWRTPAMDIRIPLGTAALALLLFPLGAQLVSTTSMTPPSVVPGGAATPKPETAAIQMQQAEEARKASRTVTLEQESAPSELATTPAPSPPVDQEFSLADSSAPDSDALGRVAAPSASIAAQQQLSMAPMAEMTAPGLVMPAPAESYSQAPTYEVSGDQFTTFDESPVKVVAQEPVSTFSIDVDTASYSYVRRMIGEGLMPQADAVRIEELINYFPYDYPAATNSGQPFAPSISITPTPWNPKTELLHIGIKGYVPPVGEDKPSNLVFLIDTSGSMDEPDKLPLLKRAFGLLVDRLTANDTVSIVAYAGSAGTVLEPTSASDKARILAALDNLSAGGSTAGAEGIALAYQLAEQHRVDGGVNRVILATDGDFNVGIADPDQLIDFIKQQRDDGVFLSVLGFGRGNLDDATMQALAQNGNGVAAYIDSFREAQKVLVEEIGSTLETIAKDVKIQVEFNPASVAEYRLVGYETRALNREDFNNDKVDAGDIGAGHTVTAIYEIVPKGSDGALVEPLRYGGDPAPEVAPSSLPQGELAYLKIRYKAPEGDTSRLIEVPVTTTMAMESLAEASDDVRFSTAVAAFGQKLKGSNYGDMSWGDIVALAQGARGTDENGYRAEFVQMVRAVETLR